MSEKVRVIGNLIREAKVYTAELHPQCQATQMVITNLNNALYELGRVAGASEIVDPLIKEREEAKEAVKTAEQVRTIETMEAHFQQEGVVPGESMGSNDENGNTPESCELGEGNEPTGGVSVNDTGEVFTPVGAEEGYTAQG